MEFNLLGEPPIASAVRTVKIVLILAFIEKIFESNTIVRGEAGVASYDGARGYVERIALPDNLASRLSNAHYVSQGLMAAVSLNDRFARVAAVLKGDAHAIQGMKLKGNEDETALEVHLGNEHCARIATAAEWLFDVDNDGASAMAFVQLAIAFEALYGDVEGEPIRNTISNRIAYSLGETPGDREQLAKQFNCFYGTRSKVVHNGAMRLSSAQRREFEWGRETIIRCLRHELSLIPGATA